MVFKHKRQRENSNDRLNRRHPESLKLIQKELFFFVVICLFQMSNETESKVDMKYVWGGVQG